MAEDVIRATGGIEAADSPHLRTNEPSRADRARGNAYRGRFVLVYFGLALVLGCGVGALVVGLTSTSTKKAAPAAQAFTPETSGEPGAIDLAANVQREYRLANGQALVDVLATRNTLQDGNLGLLRVPYQIIQPSDAEKDRDSQIIRANDAIQFSLCGNAASCAIPGSASVARASLIRRQGLELALRTFGNDPQVDNVVVFLRPVPAPQGSSFEGYLLMFSRGLIDRNDPNLLTRPLNETLPGLGSRITPAQLAPEQILKIDELTKPYLYLFRYQLVGGHDAVLDLQPPGI